MIVNVFIMSNYSIAIVLLTRSNTLLQHTHQWAFYFKFLLSKLKIVHHYSEHGIYIKSCSFTNVFVRSIN